MSIHRCDGCGKRRAGVTVVDGRDLCPFCATADRTAAEVARLPRRTAHALHALLEATHALGPRVMPLTAAEICVYDEEASGPRATGNALAHARRLGLVTFDGRYWWPSLSLGEFRAALENRYLSDVDADL